MTSITRRAIVGVALGLPLGACGPQAGALPEVPSLLEALPTLEAAALAWQEDGYLESAEIEFPGPPGLTSYVSAVFGSRSGPHEIVHVVLEREGTVGTRTLQTLALPSPEQAITQQDFDLDTAEALELALDDSGRRWLEDNPQSQCSFMQLRRDSRFPDHSVVWRLVLRPCPLGDSIQDVTIDAITGEVLERK